MIALLGRVVLVMFLAFHHFEYFVPISSGLQNSFEKSTDSLMGAPLLGNCFSLGAFKILSFLLSFGILIMMCVGVGLIGFILFRTLCFLDLGVYFCHRLGKFLVTVSSNRFSISCSLFSLSGIPVIQMLCWMLSQSSCKLSSFKKFFFFLLF
uniref:Uncharacterized protein n=1 Tax=Myotis myotis TaxID=51298 RepID=A0A7J7Z4X5_MYOMY|nr:hypothetical protein mMyoMyo1_010567 [Myotis myotis]